MLATTYCFWFHILINCIRCGAKSVAFYDVPQFLMYIIKSFTVIYKTGMKVYIIFSAFLKDGCHVEDMVPGAFALSDTSLCFL